MENCSETEVVQNSVLDTEDCVNSTIEENTKAESMSGPSVLDR